MPRWVGRAWRMVTWSRWSGNSEIAAAEETLGGLDGFSGQRLLTRHFVDDALEAECTCRESHTADSWLIP